MQKSVQFLTFLSLNEIKCLQVEPEEIPQNEKNQGELF